MPYSKDEFDKQVAAMRQQHIASGAQADKLGWGPGDLQVLSVGTEPAPLPEDDDDTDEPPEIDAGLIPEDTKTIHVYQDDEE